MKRRRGITLVEVLATLTIIAIVLPVVMKGIALATTLAGQTRQRSEATSLAESKMNELIVSGDWQSGQLSGDFGTDWPGYTWHADVAAWDEADLNELHVAVLWTSRSVQRQIVLTTLVYSGSTP
jgi:type II secretion system protein I